MLQRTMYKDTLNYTGCLIDQSKKRQPQKGFEEKDVPKESQLKSQKNKLTVKGKTKENLKPIGVWVSPI